MHFGFALFGIPVFEGFIGPSVQTGGGSYVQLGHGMYEIAPEEEPEYEEEEECRFGFH